MNDRPLLSGIALTVIPGESHVIFGPNGSGKSSLIKAITVLPLTASPRATSGSKGVDRGSIDRRAGAARDRARVPAAASWAGRLALRAREGAEAR